MYLNILKSLKTNKKHTKIRRSDQGGEYTSRDFIKYCKDNLGFRNNV
jgi:hypothetical protein